MKEIVAKAIRQLLFVAGGALGTKAAASESDIEAITSAVMVIGSLAWSWWNEVQKRKAAAKAAAVTGAIMALTIAGVGCATVAPGNDPFVVRSEQTINNSVNAIDVFLSWEYENPKLSPPAVKSIAASLRQRAPEAIRSAKRLVRTYKYNRTPDNKVNAETALKLLSQLVSEVDAGWKATGLKTDARLSVPKAMAVDVTLLILGLIGAAGKLIDLAQKARDEAARNKELTPEQEALIDEAHEELFKKPHWKQ